MTDVLIEEATPPDTEIRICQAEGCDVPLPSTGQGWKWRKYCDDHKPARPAAGKKKDRAPRGGVAVNVNVGGGKKKSDDLEAVKERAEWLVTTTAALLLLAQQPDDAADLKRGGEPWAESVRDLAEHEEWLKKLFTGGETSARVLAWIAFGVSTAGLLSPILIRHGLVPMQVLQLMAQQEAVVVDEVNTLIGQDRAA